MDHHPLSTVADRIRTGAWYDADALGALLGVSRSSICALRSSGYLPGGQLRPTGTGWGRGSRRTEWTGAALLAAARIEDLPPLDHTALSASTLWRLGCGCDDCLTWHNQDTRQRRRIQAQQQFPKDARRRFLELVSAGTPIPTAAGQVGVRASQVFGLARWHTEFASALNEAGWALCTEPDSTTCSTPGAYKRGCRGTGCRHGKRPTDRTGSPAVGRRQ